MKFCTSDTHFFHDSLLGTNKFAPRPFNNVNEMNQTIINNWNDKVGENDIVYHLGTGTNDSPARSAASSHAWRRSASVSLSLSISAANIRA